MKKRIGLIVSLLLVLAILCGCVSDADRYRTAQEKLTAGDLAGALKGFSEIEKYEDASQYVMYITALQAVESGDYAAAITGFNALGDFNDSKLQAAYYTALTAEQAGDFAAARDLYAAIPGFKDASERVLTLEDKLLEQEFNAVAEECRTADVEAYYVF